MDLSIVIVSWKVKKLLEECLNSIFNQTKEITYEVWVVDNFSQDGTVEMVKEKFPQVHLIANPKNLGFAKANNQAIRLAKGKFILLLNPDTKILDNALEKIVHFMEENPNCGVVGGKLLNPDGSLQPSVRRFPRFLDQALILLKIHHFLPNLPPLRAYLAKNFDYDKKQEVDQIMGAFFLIRREVIEEVGLLDENFWIWFEEVDYCQRVKKAGKKVCYCPQAKIIHYFGQSFKQRLSLDKQRIYNRSLSYYFKKHHSFINYLLINLLRPLSLFLAALTQMFKI